jgi:hypothetical protein
MPNGNGHSTKFTPGAVAEVIALAGPGEEVPSSFEPFKQMRYKLADGRTWYASLAVGVKLHNLQLGAGEMFRVCKRPFGKGSVIDVMRCNGQDASADPAPDQGGSVLEAKLAASVAAVRKPAEQPAVAPAGQPKTASSLVSGNGTAPPPAVPVNGNGESAVDLAMKAAIDVCARGQVYATAKGMHILFVGEDVRTIMNTILIGQQKANGSRY